MSKRYIVARTSDVAPGSQKAIVVAGREICLINQKGEFFATSNRCPHAGGRLCFGDRVGLVSSSSPGQYTYTRNGEILKCPWHGWEFDIRTGRSVCDPRKTRVVSYPTQVESGETLKEEVELTVEIFTVSIDEDYVCIHL